MKIRVGTSGYSYKEWKGNFYPEKIPATEMLRFYATRLGAVEINYTFYHMPNERLLLSWAKKVPGNFTFIFKAPRVITHRKRLKNTAEETGYFLKTLAVLGKKLGPVLFQFPGNFHAGPAVLEDFLALVPKGISCAFEFRSSSRHDPEILEILRQKKYSLCIADTDEEPATEIISTAPWGYLRLRRTDYTDKDLAQWREKILAQKWRSAYVFFKHEEAGKGPAAAINFQELIGPKRN